MAQTVIGIFDSRDKAQTAVQQLSASGISPDRIDIADRTSTNTETTSERYDDNDDDSIGGFFRALFGGEDDARKYSSVARRGCVVTVHAQTDDEASRAADLLDDSGAVDVEEQAARYGYSGAAGNMGTTGGAFASGTGLAGMPGSTTGTTGMTGSTGLNDTTHTTADTDYNRNNLDTDNVNTDRAFPIIEENLQVGKREVETGGVRLRSRIVERPVEEHLRLREEHVNVQRNPVNRPASDADLNTFREGTIELTEHAEVPVINKEAHVVEEVSLNKNIEEREEVVRDTVRKTEVDVEDLDRTNTRNSLDNRTSLDDSDDNNGLDLDNDRRRTGMDYPTTPL